MKKVISAFLVVLLVGVPVLSRVALADECDEEFSKGYRYADMRHMWK